MKKSLLGLCMAFLCLYSLESSASWWSSMSCGGQTCRVKSHGKKCLKNKKLRKNNPSCAKMFYKKHCLNGKCFDKDMKDDKTLCYRVARSLKYKKCKKPIKEEDDAGDVTPDESDAEEETEYENGEEEEEGLEEEVEEEEEEEEEE